MRGAKRPLNALIPRGKCGSLIAKSQNFTDKIKILGVRYSYIMYLTGSFFLKTRGSERVTTY